MKLRLTLVLFMAVLVLMASVSPGPRPKHIAEGAGLASRWAAWQQDWSQFTAFFPKTFAKPVAGTKYADGCPPSRDGTLAGKLPDNYDQGIMWKIALWQQNGANGKTLNFILWCQDKAVPVYRSTIQVVTNKGTPNEMIVQEKLSDAICRWIGGRNSGPFKGPLDPADSLPSTVKWRSRNPATGVTATSIYTKATNTWTRVDTAPLTPLPDPSFDVCEPEPPPSVGGLSLDPGAGGSSGSDAWLLAELIAGTAATAVALGGAAWYTRRRSVR